MQSIISKGNTHSEGTNRSTDEVSHSYDTILYVKGKLSDWRRWLRVHHMDVPDDKGMCFSIFIELDFTV